MAKIFNPHTKISMTDDLRDIFGNLYNDNRILLDNDIKSIEIINDKDNDGIQDFKDVKDPKVLSYPEFKNICLSDNFNIPDYMITCNYFVTLGDLINNKSIEEYIELFTKNGGYDGNTYLNSRIINPVNNEIIDLDNRDIKYDDLNMIDSCNIQKVDTVYIFPDMCQIGKYVAKFNIYPTYMTLGKISYLNQLSYQLAHIQGGITHFDLKNWCITRFDYYCEGSTLYVYCDIST